MSKTKNFTYKNKPKYRTIVVREKDFQKLVKVGVELRFDGIIPDETPKDALLFHFAVKGFEREYRLFQQSELYTHEVSFKTLN